MFLINKVLAISKTVFRYLLKALPDVVKTAMTVVVAVFEAACEAVCEAVCEASLLLYLFDVVNFVKA